MRANGEIARFSPGTEQKTGVAVSLPIPWAQVVNSLPAEQPTSPPEPPAAVSPNPPGIPPAVCAEAELPLEPASGEESNADGRRGKPTLVVAAVEAWLVAGRTSSWLASALMHMGIVLLLSLFILAQPKHGQPPWLEGAFEPDLAEQFDLNISELDSTSGDITVDQSLTASMPAPGDFSTVGTIHPSLQKFSTATKTPRDSGRVLEAVGQPLESHGGGMEGRHASNRLSLALGNGGSEASESAVERGLAWLAAHQFEDGGWRFDLRACPNCGGQCKNSGVVESTTASTGMALLCFLGAGYTQDEGPYQEVVAAGLYYLVDKMLITSMGGDLRDNSLLDELVDGQPQFRKSGDMYCHGIATLALCEAYAMTRDKSLAEPAQEAVNFIVYAQHEKGGWRYEPKQPGDTTVSGWQVTALKSALLAKLEVPRSVWYRASDYFDGVQDDRGATYGYQSPDKNRHSTSVVGLFSRMILGWPHNHPPLAKGMARIAKQYPNRNHMYFNYYATQALFHTGGPGWERWNPRMREYLVNLQSSEGHESGSWYIDENWSDRGGRLYSTALAILTLEVYYRYMPMYGEAFVEDSP